MWDFDSITAVKVARKDNIVLQEKRHFFAENERKHQKIRIITLTPEVDFSLFSPGKIKFRRVFHGNFCRKVPRKITTRGKIVRKIE
jgi:hypothetical protein